jgi:Ca-activated chloride channel family protein
MFPAPVEYNDENVEKAVERIGCFKADLGGTDIYSPLHTIFKSESKYPRSIFLLTDGNVGNTSQTLDLIKSNRRDSRVHAFGIGSDVDRHLIVESAKVGKGAHVFVS